MSTKLPRVLVLAGKVTDPNTVTELLREKFEVTLRQNVEEAAADLYSAQFQAVFAELDKFASLERALAAQQGGMVLDAISEGVFVIYDGVNAWANKRMRSYPAEVNARIKQICFSARDAYVKEAAAGTIGSRPALRSRKLGFQVGADQQFVTFISPVLDDAGKVRQIVAIVLDDSGTRLQQERLDALNSAGRDLLGLGADALIKLNAPERIELLGKKLVPYVQKVLGFDHFHVRMTNKKSNELDSVIAHGMPASAQELSLYAEAEGNGISGYVAATGRSYHCRDVEKDQRYMPGLPEARSCLTVPLFLDNKVLGTFNAESPDPNAFDEEDLQFAEMFGRYIAVALNILNLLVVERFTVSTRMAETLQRELSGPINDVVAEINALKEEHLDDEKTRKKLANLVQHVDGLRASMKEITEGRRAILGAGQVSAQADSVLAGKKVLVADDDASIRNTIRDVLVKMGCLVTACKDGHEAVSALEKEPVDMVISDIRMPHRNGYEIYAAAQREGHDTPVILMTGFGYDPDHSIVRASQEGLEAVLFKPFKIEQLLDALRKALGVEVKAPPVAAAAEAKVPS